MTVAISPDNRWLVIGSSDKTARLCDLSAKDPAANPVVLRGHEGVVAAVASGPDNRWVVTGSFDNTARLWDLSLSCKSRRKNGKEISLGLSESTTSSDFKCSMSGKVISITYLGAGSIHEEIERILRRIEYWHQGSTNPSESSTGTLPGWATRSNGMERIRRSVRCDDHDSRAVQYYREIVTPQKAERYW